MAICSNCGKKTYDVLETAYGEVRCEDCWDDYLMTDSGKVEYFLGIVRGDYSMSDFDADFLCHVSACWRKYRWYVHVSARDLRDLEDKAIQMGLL